MYNQVSFSPIMIFTLLKIGIADEYELHPPEMSLSLFLKNEFYTF
jgi:hypothetical protein